MWTTITREEYGQIIAASPVLHVGETLSDPDGSLFGKPHMLTTWCTTDDQPVVRHQCWPTPNTAGHSRPCLFETWQPDEVNT
jgi:hypothetical protein